MATKIKKSHIFNGLLLVFVLLMLFSPGTKAWVSQGLMKLGLFRADLEAPAEQPEVVSQPVASSSMAFAEGHGNTPVLFMDSSGAETDAANLKGKVVFMNFWATWCPPCIAEMPSIDKLYQQFKNNDQIVFLMVDVDNQMIKSEAFMTKKKLSLPVHVPMGTIPSHWLGGAIPTTVILDKNGQIVARNEGMADYSRKEVVEFITNLINE